MNFASTLWVTVLQANVPEHALSRVSSYDWLGSLVFLPAGYMLAGPVAEAVRRRRDARLRGGLGVASTCVILSLEAVRGVRRDAPKAGP